MLEVEGGDVETVTDEDLRAALEAELKEREARWA